jgi:MinD-like ATPase involved in chromosome partitioning or flagellar assembly
MGRLIAVHSFRGGTGKSNISGNVAAWLATQGHRVGIIDTDIQSPGLHALFGVSPANIQHTLNDYLLGRCGIEEAAFDVTASIGKENGANLGRIYLIPSSMKTGEITHIIQSGYDVGRLNIGFQQLIQKLELDYLLVDTHPGVNEETLLAAAISDALVLILRPDRQDYQGTAIMLELARKLHVPHVHLVINKAVSRSDFKVLQERVVSTFKERVLAVIPLSDDVAALGSSGLFCVEQPEHEFTLAIQKIAAEL